MGARRAHLQGPWTHQRPQQNHSSHCVCLNVAADSFCGGTPCPTKLPHPISGNILTFACAWIPAGTALLGIISFTCISCHARPFPVSGPAEQDPYPNALISFCFAGMLFLVSRVLLEPIFFTHFACMFGSEHQHLPCQSVCEVAFKCVVVRVAMKL